MVNHLDFVPQEALGLRFDSHQVLPIPWGHANGPLFTRLMWRERFTWIPFISWGKVSGTTIINIKKSAFGKFSLFIKEKLLMHIWISQ